MKMDTGMVIVVGMVLLFYLRLIVIQWGKANRFNRNKKLSKGGNYDNLKFRFNWILLGLGAAIIILGILITATTWFGPWFKSNWWIFVSVGILIFGMGIRN